MEIQTKYTFYFRGNEKLILVGMLELINKDPKSLVKEVFKEKYSFARAFFKENNNCQNVWLEIER